MQIHSAGRRASLPPADERLDDCHSYGSQDLVKCNMTYAVPTAAKRTPWRASFRSASLSTITAFTLSPSSTLGPFYGRSPLLPPNSSNAWRARQYACSHIIERLTFPNLSCTFLATSLPTISLPVKLTDISVLPLPSNYLWIVVPTKRDIGTADNRLAHLDIATYQSGGRAWQSVTLKDGLDQLGHCNGAPASSVC